MLSNEFSRIVDITSPSIAKGATKHFSPLPQELVALGERFGVEVLSFEGDVTFELAKDRVSTRVEGAFSATVMQQCGVTLKKIKNEIEGQFRLFFSPLGHGKVCVYEDEDQEFYETPEVDVGEIMAQYLCLHMDTSPRDPAADFAPDSALGEGDVKSQPFSVLKRLVDQGEK